MILNYHKSNQKYWYCTLGKPTELVIDAASAPQLVQQRLLCVLCWLEYGAYKRPLYAN